MPQIAKQQIGRYEILEEIGRGAMGVVFKGRDPLIGRAVAVKTITSGGAESADLLERFYREAQAAGGLQHPNIVTIYELAESNGTPFIAMEYLEGESLEKLIARRPALPLATKAGYVAQACRALEYAHRRGVIHRDVKPANIMVTRDGVVKIVDFGIARLADTSKTQTGMLLGTLAYMSPEQIREQHADARCDIWALGVVLYELLAYQRPFTGENHAALLLSILQKEPPSIRQFVPECPVALERVILKSLRKEEKERYPSMEALLKDVENVSSSLAREGSNAVAHMPIANAQPAPTVLLASNPIGPAVHAAGAATIVTPGAHQPVKTIPKQPAPPKSHAWRNAAATCVLLAVIVVGAIGVARRGDALGIARRYNALGIVRRYNMLAVAIHPDSRQKVNVTAPAPATPPAPNAPTADAATSGAGSDPPAPSSGPSIEDQQRYLIGLAQKAAGWQDFKGAQQQLDEAAKLNGPLNDAIADLRREFSAQSHGAELERVAGEEQTLFDKAMTYLQAGDFDDAEESLREILTLPEGGHRLSEAVRYVDQVIPERREEEQLWAAAQLVPNSRDPGDLLTEIRAFDEVLAVGGRHEQGARQKHDALIAEIIRSYAEKNRMLAPVSNADQWQVTQLKNQFDDLVQKGDATALQQLQQLQSKLQSIAEAQTLLAIDAHDYLNNVIPKAQKHIQDRLAVAESNSSPNNAYMDAVKAYDRAVATQNAAMLRDQVLPLFAKSHNLAACELKKPGAMRMF